MCICVCTYVFGSHVYMHVSGKVKRKRDLSIIISQLGRFSQQMHDGNLSGFRPVCIPGSFSLVELQFFLLKFIYQNPDSASISMEYGLI